MHNNLDVDFYKLFELKEKESVKALHFMVY